MSNISLYQKAISRDRENSFSVSDVLFKNVNEKIITRVHWHKEFEFSLVKKGSVLFNCEDREYHISDGCVLVKNSAQTHSIVCESDNIDYVTIILRENYLGLNFSLIHFENVIYNDEELNEYIVKIAEEYKNRENGFDIKINSLICKCLKIMTKKHFVKLLSQSEFEEKLQKNAHINKVIDFINENYTKKITIDQLADYVCMDKFQLIRMFKKEIGKTIVEYLNEVRISHAKYLLVSQTSKLSVSKIASEVGISDYRYFCKLFKKKYNDSPFQYRKAYLKRFKKSQ